MAGALSTGGDGQCETLGAALDDPQFFTPEGWHFSGERHYTAHTRIWAQSALDRD